MKLENMIAFASEVKRIFPQIMKEHGHEIVNQLSKSNGLIKKTKYITNNEGAQK